MVDDVLRVDGVSAATLVERKVRVGICSECDNWMKFRCKAIDLGCRNAFAEAVDDPYFACPEGKWPHKQWFHTVRQFQSVQLLNLIYHVCPLKSNDVWRANIRQLMKRLRIFNGRKVVAIATGDGLHAPDVVRRSFDDTSIEYLELPNDPDLREVATFLPLLETVQSTNEWEATFYAHTKGNSTKDNALGAEMWRNQAYHSLLDHVHVCRDLLLTHPCVGTHKMIWPEGMSPYPSKLQYGTWMLAGTFFWFRNKDVYMHPKWRSVPRDRYGAEAWLSGLFKAEQAASVFQPWPVNEYPTPSPYDPALYLWPIRDT